MDTETSGLLTIAILKGDGSGGLPGTTVFSQSFNSPLQTPSWQGLTGLNSYLSAGTYWVAFEAPSDSTFLGYMDRNPPNPMNNYAMDGGPSGWEFNSAIKICVEVEGNVVPLPGTLLLLGSGLAGLGFMRRKWTLKK